MLNLRLLTDMDIPADILSKLEHYCAYQERCEADVRKKMVGMAVSASQREEIMRRLKDQKFVDDERFTEQYVRSKLHEQWGPLKIRQGLFAKGVAAEVIDAVMGQVAPEAYEEVLEDAIEKWRRTNPATGDDRSRLIRALLSKGFAMGEILSKLKS